MQASALSEGGKSEDGKEGKEVVDYDAVHKDERGKGTWLRLFQLSLPELPYTILACLGAAMAGAINPVFGLLLTTVRRRQHPHNFFRMIRQSPLGQ